MEEDGRPCSRDFSSDSSLPVAHLSTVLCCPRNCGVAPSTRPCLLEVSVLVEMTGYL